MNSLKKCGISLVLWVAFCAGIWAGPVMDIQSAIKVGNYSAAARTLALAYRQDPQNRAVREFIRKDSKTYLKAAYEKGEALYLAPLPSRIFWICVRPGDFWLTTECPFQS